MAVSKGKGAGLGCGKFDYPINRWVHRPRRAGRSYRAMISSKVCEWVNARGITARDLLGCATGAAVAASFNAPIAGALFALEVILRHFALHAFAPIVIASVAGAVVHQMAFGDQVEFNLPLAPDLQFYVELPAFMGLGLVAGVVAVILMRSIFLADQIASGIQDHLTLPRWLRPAVAGVLLGLIATQFPVIIGVGYETTYAALSGKPNPVPGDFVLHY